MPTQNELLPEYALLETNSKGLINTPYYSCIRILTSPAIEPFDNSFTNNGFISISIISGKSTTSREIFNSTSTVVSISESFSPLAPFRLSRLQDMQ
jgi:hypothetical protein